MSIFPDVATGGQWHYCYGCPDGANCGDMLQLAARKWQLSIPATISKLVRAGVRLDCVTDREEAVRSYERNHVRQHERLYKLWTSSNGNKIRVGEGRGRLRQIGWSGSSNTPSAGGPWDRGPGQLAGLAHANDVNRAVLGHLKKFTETATSSQLFRGRRWDNLLLFPYYNVPGRIHALYMIGRDMRPDEDALFKVVGPVSKKVEEAGLWYHPSVLASRNPIVMFDSPVTPGRIYMRNAALQDSIPAMGAWHADLTHRTSREAWYPFFGRKIVFWTASVESEVVIQAIRAGGFIYVSEVEHASDERGWNKYRTHWVNTLKSDPQLKKMVKNSKPWAVVLSDYLQELDDSDVEDLFRKLQEAGEDKDRILRQCDAVQAERCHKILANSRGNRFILLDGKNIEERESGWYVTTKTGREELVTDAILRIEKVLSQPKASKTLLRGHILFDNKAVPFCEDKNAIERNPLKWMQEYLIHKQIGLISFNPSWKYRIVQLATRFHPPKLSTGLEAVGWNPAEQCFDLPSYRIKSFGELESNDGADVDGNTPAVDLPEPMEIAPTDFGSLLDITRANTMFWASWIAMVSSIVAPALGKKPDGLLLVGMGAAEGAKLAGEALGIKDYAMTGQTPEFLLDQARTHNWPVGAGLDNNTLPAAKAKRLIDGPASHNLVIPTTWYPCVTAMVNGGWNCVVNQKPVEYKQNVVELAKPLLPSYLQHLMKVNLQLNWNKRSLVDCVFSSVSDWIASLHGSPTILKWAKERLLAGSIGIRARLSANLLGYLVYDGLVVAKKGLVRERKNTLWIFPNSYFLPKAALANALSEKGVAQIKPAKLSECLMLEKALIGETEINGISGWSIQKQWFDAQVKKVHRIEVGPADKMTNYKTELRVVG